MPMLFFILRSFRCMLNKTKADVQQPIFFFFKFSVPDVQLYKLTYVQRLVYPS